MWLCDTYFMALTSTIDRFDLRYLSWRLDTLDSEFTEISNVMGFSSHWCVLNLMVTLHY